MCGLTSFFKMLTPVQRSIVAFHLVDHMSHEKVARTLNLNLVEYTREWEKARLAMVGYFASIHMRP